MNQVTKQENKEEKKQWWPNKLDTDILALNTNVFSPIEEDFNYKEAYNSIDIKELKKDIFKMMLDSKQWWPADYGHYGPLFIRMAWHYSGTYRQYDGIGGGGMSFQRFMKNASWKDNANLDKARRLVWPIKKKYGNKISWSDLILLVGNCAFESMGIKTIGFGGGREELFNVDESYDFGVLHNLEEKATKYGAVDNELIYVDPEGPKGVPNIMESAKDVRLVFERMGMNDEETVALIAGGHTFGKAHGASKGSNLSSAPDKAKIQEMGFGWKNKYKSGKGVDTITSGIEGAWTSKPTVWDNGFFVSLFKYDYNLEKSPAGAWQWVAVNVDEEDLAIDAHIKSKKHAPIMTTPDLALKMDPIYKEISLKFAKDQELFGKVFMEAWFKLIHRDMGPKSRYLGYEVPAGDFIWQDPLPRAEYNAIDDADIKVLKDMIKKENISVQDLVKVAWASASVYRKTDHRGGANGARVTLAPQKDFTINQPALLANVVKIYEKIKTEFNNSKKDNKQVSMADLIVLGGNVGIEIALENGGSKYEVPFTKGRVDALQEQTDIKAFNYLKPTHDGFRSYLKRDSNNADQSQEELLVNQAKALGLSSIELTVLMGGLKVININYDNSNTGILTNSVGTLSNDYFVNLLDMDNEWIAVDENEESFKAINIHTEEEVFTATRADLIFGSHFKLRTVVEYYAQDDNKEKFKEAFIKVWNKIMNNDRFDI